MSAVIEDIPNIFPAISPMADEELPIDLLNRQGFIDQIIQILNIVSDNHSTCTFALNGTWGVGKTFVLTRLIRQLLEYQDGEKFFVFHYNCWQYDYYEEPLIAIVAAMLDSVDQENHLFSRNLRKKAREGMTIAKPIIVNIAKDFFEKKIGVDINNLITLFKGSVEAIEGFHSKEDDNYNYDKYYSFRKAISSAKDGIRTLSQKRTVVVIVDELDRCLPNYAIKVMERLHHLFGDLENCAVILAVDKGQLDQTVKQIFGIDTDTTKYLKKFINFEIQLDTGRIEGSFTEKYADYVSLFDNSLIETEFSFDKFFSALFAGVDSRTQERTMDRIKTVHTLLFPNTTKDYSFMCIEVMWVVLTEIRNFTTRMPIYYNSNLEKDCFCVSDESIPEFSEYMYNEWFNINMRNAHYYAGTSHAMFFLPPIDVPQLLVWYLCQMYQDSLRDYKLDRDYPHYKELLKNVEDLKRFDQLLKIIN